MRRSFLLTVVGGVLITIAGCGGEVAQQTASTSSSSPPPSSASPSSGPGSSTPTSTPSSAPRSGPGGPQGGSGSAVPQSGPGGPQGAMGTVLSGPGQPAGSSGSSDGFPSSYPGAMSGPSGAPQSGPGGPGGAGNNGFPSNYAGPPLPGNPTGVSNGGGGGTNQGSGSPQSGPGGPQSGPGGPQSGPGGPGGSGGINYPAGYPGNGLAPLPGDPTGVSNGGGGGTPTGEPTGPPQSGPGNGGDGTGTATMGASVRFGPPGGTPGVPASGPGGGTMGPMGPMGPMGGPGQQQAPAIPTPTNLKEFAEREFRIGHDSQGFQFMHGWFVGDPDGEEDLDLRFLALTNLPKTSVRIGIGIEYQAPGNLEGAPPTIGEQPNVLAGNNNNRNRNGGPGSGLTVGPPDAGGGTVSPPGPQGAPGSGGGAASEPSDSLGQFKYYTGSLGEDLVSRLQMLRTSNDAPFGKFLKGITVEWPRQAASSGFAMGYPGGSSGPGGAGFNPTGASMGPGGGAGPLGPGGPGGQPAPAAGAYPRDPESNQLIPGVVWLGKGRQAALVEEAREAGLDFLILFDTAIQVVPSNGQKKNTTTIMLIDVSAVEVREQIVAKSKPLNSVRVWEEQNRSDEPIEEAIDALFAAAADKGMMLSELPSLEPEQAKARVDQVVGDRPEDVLAALAEIKYFHREELINDADLLSAYESILGDSEKAQTLATGDADERLEVIKEFLPPLE